MQIPVRKIFPCLAAILIVWSPYIQFMMAKRRPNRNSDFMKAIRDVSPFFQEDSFKIKIINWYYYTQK